MKQAQIKTAMEHLNWLRDRAGLSIPEIRGRYSNFKGLYEAAKIRNTRPSGRGQAAPDGPGITGDNA